MEEQKIDPRWDSNPRPLQSVECSNSKGREPLSSTRAKEENLSPRPEVRETTPQTERLISSARERREPTFPLVVRAESPDVFWGGDQVNGRANRARTVRVSRVRGVISLNR
uniref:Uncharacterized protein n=1 Tax=Globodera rostochiensis TaxID=31243 RepID=A0A914HJK2_GLORO